MIQPGTVPLYVCECECAVFAHSLLAFGLLCSSVGKQLALGVAVCGPVTSSLATSSSSSQQSGPGAGPGGGPGGMMKAGMDQLGTNFNQISASITPQVFTSAIGITFLIAILGSAIPAYFIARIRPAEVLRTE